jgi:hypothetical protein
MDARVTQVVDDVRRRLTDEFEQHQARAREREHALQVLVVLPLSGLDIRMSLASTLEMLAYQAHKLGHEHYMIPKCAHSITNLIVCLCM